MKNKIIFNILLFLFIIANVFSCKKYNVNEQLSQVKDSNNYTTYPNTKMDSAQAIHHITKQKVNEILDLAILYKTGNQDTELDSVLYKQMMDYFYKPDTATLKNLFAEIDSFQVKSAKINQFKIVKKIYKKDTLNYAQFSVEYFDGRNQPINKFDREAQYVLVPAEIQFKKEFKFYFLNFYNKPLNEKIVKKLE